MHAYGIYKPNKVKASKSNKKPCRGERVREKKTLLRCTESCAKVYIASAWWSRRKIGFWYARQSDKNLSICDDTRFNEMRWISIYHRHTRTHGRWMGKSEKKRKTQKVKLASDLWERKLKYNKQTNERTGMRKNWQRIVFPNSHAHKTPEVGERRTHTRHVNI